MPNWVNVDAGEDALAVNLDFASSVRFTKEKKVIITLAESAGGGEYHIDDARAAEAFAQVVKLDKEKFDTIFADIF